MKSDLISRQAAVDALMVAVDTVGILDAEDIKVVFDDLPTIDMNKLITDYCIKRNLVIITLETFEKWQTVILRDEK